MNADDPAVDYLAHRVVRTAMADPLSPELSLTPDERQAVRRLVRSDNHRALSSALTVAVGCAEEGEQLIERMLATMRGGRPCEES